MKKFVYRLEPLLKMRREKEDLIANELSELLGEIVLTERRIASNEMQRQEFEADFLRRKTEGVSALELMRGSEGAEFFRRVRFDLLEIRADLEEKSEQKKRELSEAMKERKIMEKLKENAYLSYMEEYEAAERKAIEEIVTYRGSKKSAERQENV